MMIKSDLRKKYRELRNNLSREELAALSCQICNNFKTNFKIATGSKVHIFISSSNLREVDTNGLIQFFFENNCRVYVPKVQGSDMLSVEVFPGSSYRKNRFGIDEPESLATDTDNYYDCVVAPLVYCDAQGNRVGYGRGFYDRFFQKINPSALKVGLSFFPPKESIEDASAWDVSLDYLVLPEDVLSLGERSPKFTK